MYEPAVARAYQAFGLMADNPRDRELLLIILADVLFRVRPPQRPRSVTETRSAAGMDFKQSKAASQRYRRRISRRCLDKRGGSQGRYQIAKEFPREIWCVAA